ncbi:MAG: CRISPR-associated helicase Cas3' [Deltaproteobacteria bacterium]|nr:CRISPR-associated helicase Cas3' [Deltaproteobacteria bacterium]
MIRLLWAKRRNRFSEEVDTDASYHPLLFHLIDVAAVVELLWQEVLKRHFKEQVSQGLGLDAAVAGTWLAFFAGLHDFGKATPVFQGKWEEARERLREASLPCSPPEVVVSHGALTAALLQQMLHQHFPAFPPRLVDPIGLVLGGHHGIFPRASDLGWVTRKVRGGERWRELQDALLQAFISVWGVSGLRVPKVPELGPAFLLGLAGLVSVADWIGSNEEFFQFTSPETDHREYPTLARRRARQALAALGWLGWQEPQSLVSLPDLFPIIRTHGLRPLQAAAAEVGAKLTEPGLVIVEAPMGEGKTEAALYLADCWAVSLGQKGCYVALPTMATSNQMFSRVQEFLLHRYPEALVNLQLLHGHASLSAEFQVLRQRADRLFSPVAIQTEEADRPGWPQGDVVAAEWFTHRKRGLMAPYGVGTVDQALLAVLKTRHYFVRLFGLSHKTVIVDEVHAYDAYMVTLLERLLEWLAAFKCSVVLLSATLPQARREALFNAYVKGMGRAVDTLSVPATRYPRLTWATASAAGALHFEASRQFSRTLRLQWLPGGGSEGTNPADNLGEMMATTLAEGGCAAVICNTVSRAQELYAALKKYFPSENAGDGWPELDMYHARFLFEGREEKEQRALLRFGKPGGRVGEKEVRRPRRAVLVATQVIEQSLDLDYDLMVTEMAPVDLLLQRAGRLHRHTRPKPAGLQEPTLWVMSPERLEPAPAFGAGSEAVYDYHILLKSWLALNDRTNIDIPEDVEGLIESVYGAGQSPVEVGPEVMEAWHRSREELERSLAEEAYQARTRYILPPDYPDDILQDQNPELEEDDPAVHRSLQAVTRLGDPTVTLVFLHEVEGQACLDPQGKKPVPLAEKPDSAAAMALLRRSVSFFLRGLTQWLLKKGEIPPGWLKHPLLCRNRLILLDQEGRWRGGGYELQLDPELGVVVTHLGKEGK